MAGWSSLGRIFQGGRTLKCISSANIKDLNLIKGQTLRLMSGHGPRTLPLQPSRWQWHKFKDMAHFYFMVGIIPVTLIVFYTNVFIGPAKLSEIPPDYEPKYWEYERHPISRFIARYLLPSPQQEYEKYLHCLYEEDEKAKIRKLENKIRAKMAELRDFQGYYVRPVDAKYIRLSKEAADYLESLRGD